MSNGFYKRALPSPPAIQFASAEGKELLIEAIQSGTMENFCRLISYSQTQSEPAYCGLASLSMVQNALAIDPGRKWKGPWRWFDESMLDCCEPLETIKVRGISFGKLVCLAHCAGAKVEAFRTNHSTIDEFREYVMRCFTGDDCFMLISRPHREPGQLYYTLSCKHESWVGVTKYLMDDTPFLSVVFVSLPSYFEQFMIRWVAQVRGREDMHGGQSLSPEEKATVAVKEEVLRQVQDTGLFKHVAELLSSARVHSCCENLISGHEANIAASVCCQGAQISASLGVYFCQETCVKCLKANGGDKPVTVGNGGTEKRMDMLTAWSKTNSGCSCAIRMHPACNDVLTVLLLALPPGTWSGIKDEKLSKEIYNLVSTENLPTLLQEEGRVDEDLGAPLTYPLIIFLLSPTHT
ncbi:Glutathione gamma-glutamylcysteinyltransferase 1 [Pyrus ussuriensis x Pyrus communis]|uniref:glutathione gamma-glutamylcysteinyltransferase n=1 Tax=Pyrus ussuriensis x Pyrus communis TaxID=2448454 RepID=A0A5N5GXM7_9ROSA|nr:Glutathione gamma-glutamylcysteinyltransferase 1 [Pyrus ussuriensis x Pyrus communis]